MVTPGITRTMDTAVGKVTRMRRLKRSIYALILVIGMLLGGTVFAVQAQAAGAGEAYYLFYRLDKSIHKNCPGTYFVKNVNGDWKLHPYRIYQTVSGGTSTNGYFETDTWVERGFSTADQQLWCRKGDFVYEFFGVHKVRRIIQNHFYCSGGGCAYLFTHTGPWRSYNWP